MKLNRILLPALLAATLAVVPGCKKEETASKSLEGYLSLDLPAFMQGGESKAFMIDTLMTLTCPDGEPIGYYFHDAAASYTDTLVTADGKFKNHYFTYIAPTELGSATLTLGAFMSKDSAYSGFRTSVSTTVVYPGLSGDGSITGFDKTGSTLFQDERDGREYYSTTIGGREWMRQNLAWNGAGVVFDDSNVMGDIFGRYYTWEEAQTACPAGWRLPTDAEVAALKADAPAASNIPGLAGKMMADLYFNGTKMWEYWREVTITDELRFSAMPVGYGVGSGRNFEFQGTFTYAVFWTSDEEAGQGVCRYIYQDKDVLYRGRMSKSDFVASVRCVKE